MTVSTDPARMAPREDRERIPRALRLGMLGLVVATLLGTAALRLGGVPPVSMPPDVARAETQTVVLEEIAGGGVSILGPAGAALATVPAGSDGFLRGVIRVVGFERGKHRIEGNPAVELIRWEDGRVSLADPATGWRLEFQGFGKGNLAQIAHLMSDIRDKKGGLE